MVQWFGSSRLSAKMIGAALDGCEHVTIPFAGSLAEAVYIKARSILASDKHEHLINLCVTGKDRLLGPRLYRECKDVLFHPKILKAAQECCKAWEAEGEHELPDFEAAKCYMIATWMNRAALAGTDKEFNGKLPIRWDAGGGDSAVRYRSALRSFLDWRKILLRCNFLCEDAFDVIEQVHDKPKHGLYIDAPWPTDGDDYKHYFTEEQQELLAKVLLRFTKTRVVVRYGDHPLIRRLYPTSKWEWRFYEGRTQSNAAKREVLLVRNP